MSLSIDDFADFELLQTIEENPKQDTHDLAELLQRERRAVASRLAWMTRMGLTVRTEYTGHWVLTAKGREMLDGRAHDLMTIREVSRRASRSRVVSWVARREFGRNMKIGRQK